MKPLILFVFLLTSVFHTQAQTQTPDEFLGYPLGSRFTSHHQVVNYFKHVAGQHPNIKLVTYGKTYEGRELMVAIISSAENMNRLEDIRNNNLAISRGQGKTVNLSNQPAILWLSYNVHGNEASSTETSMKMIYTLAEAKRQGIKEQLANTVVIIDPCLNPDGRDRFVNGFNAVSGLIPDPNPSAREHQELWPRGRSNHYYFDLNRDWAWQTQVESQGRIALYHQWMPQVHVDYHEQGYNEPYYFAPAAEPVHESITPWQREFQVTVGKNNARYFDQEGWQYFTKERFDLLYPSYGDTYPLYNGAIGMTYEQGGISAGLAVRTADGDTLTLKDRIEHHFTTGVATIETVSANAGKLVTEFQKFFINSINSPASPYQAYVVKGNQLASLKRLVNLLDKNKIEYTFGGSKSLSGFDYETGKNKSFKLERNDLIINLRQAKSVLANVLFEPKTAVTDSNTYDITAWAMPYAYGLEAYAVKENLKGQYTSLAETNGTPSAVANPYAWIFPWNGVDDARLLVALQKEGVKVRISTEAFTVGGKSYPSGTLLIYRRENERANGQLAARLAALAPQGKTFIPMASGMVEKGKDLGSSVYNILPQVKAAVVSGPETASGSVGEIWSFFEQDLKMPISMVNVQSLGNLQINDVNVLIVPSGRYPKNLDEQLRGWVEQGGKLILFEDAISAFEEKKAFNIKRKEAPKTTAAPANKTYGGKDKDDFDNAIPGAIYNVRLDKSHPLTTGISRFYTLMDSDVIYEPLSEGWTVGTLESGSYVTGIAGKNVKKKLENGMLYGVQEVGKGTVVYIGTNLLFRLFWENGKQMFVNSVFTTF